MIVRVRIKGAGKPYEYITNKSLKVGDRVLVKTYRNGTGVEAVIVKTGVRRTSKKRIRRAYSMEEVESYRAE